MGKNVVIVILVIVFLLVGGYAFYATQQMQQYKTQADQAMKSQQTAEMQLKDAQDKQMQAEEKAKQAAMQTMTLKVTLGEENKSRESGTATLTENNGKVTVKIALTGESDGAIEPAHIHAGNCPGVGKIMYPLTSIVNGTSETTLDATLDQIKKQFPLALNVHKSKVLITNYVACGSLGGTSGTGSATPSITSSPAASSSPTVTP